MTKKDFQLIADAIRRSGLDRENTRAVSKEMADTLATTNARFDKEKFCKACEARTDVKTGKVVA